MKLPRSFLSHGQIVSEAGYGLVAARGLSVSGPPLENASQLQLNQTEDELRSLLRLLRPGVLGLQVCWEVGGDYASDLLPYYKATKQMDTPFVRMQRQARYCLYSERMEKGLLRRPRLHFYLKTPLPIEANTPTNFDESLIASARSFEPHLETMKRALARLSGTAEILDESDLLQESFRFFNPSQNMKAEALLKKIQPEKRLIENCLRSEMIGVEGSDAGFYMAGYYYGCLVLSELPQVTTSGMLAPLMNLPFGEYGVSLSIEALDVSLVLEKEEREKVRLERALRGSSHTRMGYTVQAKQSRIDTLMSNEVMPLRMQMVFHVRDQEQDRLAEKLATLKAAISRMQGSQYYEMANPVTARNYFLSGTPGGGYQEKDFRLYVEDHHLSNLIPLTGEVDRELSKAEALYHTGSGNVFGVRSLIGGMPQHGFVSGWSGGGKSVFCQDLLVQMANFYDFVVLVDDGFSYPVTAQLISKDIKSFVIEAGGTETLNYLDPRGVLGSQHRADAYAVALNLLGGKVTSREEAVLEKCLSEFYADWFKNWAKQNPEVLEEVVWNLAALLEFEKVCPVSGEGKESLEELYRRYREWSESEEEIATDFVEALGEPDFKQARYHENRKLMSLAFAFMEKNQLPRHRDFQGWLGRRAESATKYRREIESLELGLEKWLATGKFGAIVDGFNTIDFSGSLIHIELGRIPDSMPELRNLIGFILANQVRNEIAFRRPRSERKCFLIEELGAFMKIQGGEEMVRQLFQQMRKYLCWVLVVCQQVSTLSEKMRDTIIANCRQAFLFKQKYEPDARALQEAFQLPEATVQTLMNLPEPTKEKGAPFIYWQNRGRNPQIITGYNLVTGEMLYAANSGGVQFESRKVLKSYDSLLEGVLTEAAKD